MENPSPRSLPKIALFSFAGIVILVVISYFLFLSSPGNFSKGIITTIEPGTSLRGLSAKLQREHIIRSRAAFEAFVIVYNGEKHIAQGDYLFEERVPVFEVARRIAKGEHHLAPVKVTIPEGFTVEEIAETFSKKLSMFNKSNFLLKAASEEGYLFPDTYFFFTTDNEEEVFSYLRNNFDQKIKAIIPEISSFGKSQKEVIIMASIVEKEAKGDTDRGFIAGILWRRLSRGMPLQVDAAPVTYKTKGLPEAPVCNPGLEAILATIHPDASDYLYYLHDSEGGIHFARTFEEHKANKRKYLSR